MTASPLVEDSVVTAVYPNESLGVSDCSRSWAPVWIPVSLRRWARRPTSDRSRLLARLGGGGFLCAGLAGATVALVGLGSAARKAPWTALLASPWALALMVSAMVVGYVMQSLSLWTLIARNSSTRDFFMLPWACASVNRVTPGATGGLLLTTRVLHRRGVTFTGSAVYLASVGIAHTLGGVLVLGVVLAAGGMSGHVGVPLGGPGLLLSLTGVLVLIVLACVPRTRARALGAIRQARQELALGRLPLVLLFQAGARLAPAIVLAGALAGLNHPLPFSTVVVVVLVASATGSLIPLPGGGGGVELALTGLLTASGLSMGAASAAVLVARLVGFWLPAALGLPALLALRRSVASSSPGVVGQEATVQPLPRDVTGGLVGPEGIRVAPALITAAA